MGVRVYMFMRGVGGPEWPYVVKKLNWELHPKSPFSPKRSFL